MVIKSVVEDMNKCYWCGKTTEALASFCPGRECWDNFFALQDQRIKDSDCIECGDMINQKKKKGYVIFGKALLHNKCYKRKRLRMNIIMKTIAHMNSEMEVNPFGRVNYNYLSALQHEWEEQLLKKKSNQLNEDNKEEQ